MVEGAETTEAGLEGGLKKKPLDESGDAKTVLTGAEAGEIVARVSGMGLGSEQVVMELWCSWQAIRSSVGGGDGQAPEAQGGGGDVHGLVN